MVSNDFCKSVSIIPVKSPDSKPVSILSVRYKRRPYSIALSYPPRVTVRATVKLSVAFFHDGSSITKEGVRKCNSAQKT